MYDHFIIFNISIEEIFIIFFFSHRDSENVFSMLFGYPQVHATLEQRRKNFFRAAM